MAGGGPRLSDARVLWHLVFRRARGKTHAERLESFYSGQAGDYDAFRKRMLHGRREMIEAVPFPESAVWVDLGAGTGENAEYLGDRLSNLSKVYQVDLSTSLLEQARKRAEQNGWQNVEPVEADATTFRPPEGHADVVTFSYSLTMIPDWFAAVDHACDLLKPGGLIGVADFYVSRKHPEEALRRHGWLTRTFWPAWFASDNVFLSPDHVPALRRRFETLVFEERRGKLPYLPLVRVPYYWFVGRKADK